LGDWAGRRARAILCLPGNAHNRWKRGISKDAADPLGAERGSPARAGHGLDDFAVYFFLDDLTVDIAWIGRNRRLAKDFEATIGSATAFLYAAAAMVLVRRIARSA